MKASPVWVCVMTMGFLLAIVALHMTLGTPEVDSVAMISVAHGPNGSAFVKK
jgi:hypothetical protein